MRYQHTGLILGFIGLLLAGILILHGMHRQTQWVSVNLGKIVRAERFYANKLAIHGVSSHQDTQKLWMRTIQEMSSQVKVAIHRVADGHPVIVQPAVIEGVADITDAVLDQLHLPHHVPHLTLPKASVLPAPSLTTTGGSTWQRP